MAAIYFITQNGEKRIHFKKPSAYIMAMGENCCCCCVPLSAANAPETPDLPRTITMTVTGVADQTPPTGAPCTEVNGQYELTRDAQCNPADLLSDSATACCATYSYSGTTPSGTTIFARVSAAYDCGKSNGQAILKFWFFAELGTLQGIIADLKKEYSNMSFADPYTRGDITGPRTPNTKYSDVCKVSTSTCQYSFTCND